MATDKQSLCLKLTWLAIIIRGETSGVKIVIENTCFLSRTTDTSVDDDVIACSQAVFTVPRERLGRFVRRVSINFIEIRRMKVAGKIGNYYISDSQKSLAKPQP